RHHPRAADCFYPRAAADLAAGDRGNREGDQAIARESGLTLCKFLPHPEEHREAMRLEGWATRERGCVPLHAALCRWELLRRDGAQWIRNASCRTQRRSVRWVYCQKTPS